MPLEVRHTHLLARAIVNTTEDVHAIVEVGGTVEEASEGHGG